MENNANISRIGEFKPLGLYYFYYCLAVKDSFVYLGSDAGLHIINVSDPHNPDSTGYIETRSISDIKIEGNYAYLTISNGGFAIVDISDPENPKEAGSLPGFADGIDIQGNYAYVVEANGLSIVDISDPNNPVVESYLLVGGSFGRDISVRGDYAYVIGDRLKIVDVSDPKNSEVVGVLFINQFCTAIGVNGNQAYLADGGNFIWSPSGLRTINISDPANPTESAMYVTGGSSANLFVDGSLIYLADGGAGLHLLNNNLATSLEVNSQSPELILHQNYPNPFDQRTTIAYQLAEPDYVTLKIYDNLGREIAILEDGRKIAGKHSVLFDADNYRGQELFYRLKVGNDIVKTKKMIVQ